MGTRKLYEDKDLGFVVLAHCNAKPHKSPPHDHGSSWAVYGQAIKHTDMSEYKRLDGGNGAGEAKLEKVKAYRLEPGHAGIYDVGAIHAIDYPEGSRFVRVTGRDLDSAAAEVRHDRRQGDHHRKRLGELAGLIRAVGREVFGGDREVQVLADLQVEGRDAEQMALGIEQAAARRPWLDRRRGLDQREPSWVRLDETRPSATVSSSPCGVPTVMAGSPTLMSS